MTEVPSSKVVMQDEKAAYNKRAISRIIWMLDQRLIPFLVLLEISRFGFQVAIGHVPLTTFKYDVILTKTMNNWATSIYYVGYLVFAIPSTFLLRLIGPSRYLSFSMVLWGAFGIGMAFAMKPYELIIIRFLFGVAAAGYYPGIIIYLSLWYPKRERIMRIAIFHGASSASGALGGVLVYVIRKMSGIAGLHDWQWIFLLEGLPIIPLGIITYLFVSNIPDTVQWLNNCEKQLLTNLLRDDAGAANGEPESNNRLSWQQVRYAFVDRYIYLYAVIVMGNLAIIKCLVINLPSIMESMGFSNTQSHLMTIPPYVLSCIGCLIGGYSSTRRLEHCFHYTFILSIGILGFILMILLTDQIIVARYISICIAHCGTFAALPVLLAWATNNIGGHTKRAVAVSFVTGVGQIGGILVPQIYREIDKPSYRQGYIIAGTLLGCVLIVTFILRFLLIKENHRREHLSNEDYDREVISKACDQHPSVRYVT